MKKWLSLLLAVLLLFTMTACSSLGEIADILLEELEETSSQSVISEAPDTESELPAPESEAEVSESEASSAESREEPVVSDLPAVSDEPEEVSSEAAVSDPNEGLTVSEDGIYDSKEEVALYIHLYGHLPSNYITKKEAERQYNWRGGTLPGLCIGGTRFGNYEELLPTKQGRTYTECDIDTLGKSKRGAKRIVFSNDGLIYYTDDHYEHFTLLYGEE